MSANSMIWSIKESVSRRVKPRIVALSRMFSRPVSSGWKPAPTSSRADTEPLTLTSPDVGLGRVVHEARVDRVRGHAAQVVVGEPETLDAHLELTGEVDREQAGVVGVDRDRDVLVEEPASRVLGDVGDGDGVGVGVGVGTGPGTGFGAGVGTIVPVGNL